MKTARALALALCAGALFAASPVRFEIKLDPSVAAGTMQGRLIVLMSTKAPRGDRLTTGFIPGEVWITATEIEAWKAGQTVTIDGAMKAAPAPFAEAKTGDYWFMALLDPDHTYGYHGPDGGDLYGPIEARTNFVPAEGGVIRLTVDKRVKAGRAKDQASIKLVEFESPMLSAFWGRPILMRAGVVLPPDYATTAERYSTVYVVHGFGGDHTTAWGAGPKMIEQMKKGAVMPKVTVYLDASCPTGHHVFADSANNGPWGRALTEELIPHIEKQFRLIAEPYARFLTGHSSGGWSTFWLQVTYPDFFGGAWSTSPDSVDFRSFTQVNATPGSTQNFYLMPDGKPINLVRMKGKDLATMEQFVRQEEAAGEYGGQIASFEWVFSPRGQDGRPMKLFNRITGELDPVVVKAWEKYDIRKTLERNWETLGPKLTGKLHIIVGDQDNFHLEKPTIMTCDFLKSKGVDVCEIVPGRDHMDLYGEYKTYPRGLAMRIDQEMKAALESGKK